MRGKQRIWITGANGRLGTALVKLLKAQGADLLTSDTDVPVGDLSQVNMYADINHPNVIINCAGLTDVALCEQNPEEAYRANALGARNMAIAARRIDAKLIQISTDDVFDGSGSAPLSEFDPAHPITMYGKSKYAGENFVRELLDKHVVVRSSWIYGAGHHDFVSDVLAQAKAGKPIQIPGDEISSPTSADALAGFIIKLISEKEYGLYHASCEGGCPRSDFAREILRLSGFADVAVESTMSGDGQALRPKFTLLDNMMLRITGFYQMPSWQDALQDYLSKTGMHAGGAE